MNETRHLSVTVDSLTLCLGFCSIHELNYEYTSSVSVSPLVRTGSTVVIIIDPK